MTVYADILFIVNLYIDALLLSAVRRFLHLQLSRFRWLTASLLGGLFGFTALLPQLHGFWLFLLGTAEAFLLICAAFAPKRTVLLLKATFLLLLFGGHFPHPRHHHLPANQIQHVCYQKNSYDHHDALHHMQASLSYSKLL